VRWTALHPHAQVVEELPDLEDSDIEAALRYANRRVDHPVLKA